MRGIEPSGVSIGDVVVVPHMGVARVESSEREGDLVHLTLAVRAGRLHLKIAPDDSSRMRAPIDAASARALFDRMRAAPPDARPRAEQALDAVIVMIEGSLEQNADRLARQLASVPAGGRPSMLVHRLRDRVLDELGHALGRQPDELFAELAAHYASRGPIPPGAPTPIRVLVPVDATIAWPSQDAPHLDEHEHAGSFTVSSGALRLADAALFGAPFPGEAPHTRADFGVVVLPVRDGRWHAYLSHEGVLLVHEHARADATLTRCGEIGINGGSMAAIDSRAVELPEVRDALTYRMNDAAFPWGWAGRTGGDGGLEIHADACDHASVIAGYFSR